MKANAGRRPFRGAIITVSLLAASGAAVAASDTAGGTPASAGLTERIERAVVIGSETELREIRQLLGERIDAGDDGAIGLDDYNLAYVNWRLGQILAAGDKADRKEQRRLLKDAQGRIEERLIRHPGEAESHALRGSVIGEQITGFFRGMFLGPKATKALDRAFELAPENPRVALQRAISYYYTPKSFGGGLDKAEQEVRRAGDLLDLEPADQSWPNWGRIDALAWLGLILNARDKPDEARSAYQTALSLEPDHAWIRDELLPALDADAEQAGDDRNVDATGSPRD